MRVVLLCSLFLASSAFGNNPLCNLYEKAVTFSAETVINELECANEEAVMNDIATAFGELNYCKEQTEDVELQASMCAQLADFIVAGLRTQIPETWECTLTNVQDDFRENLEKLCKRKPKTSENEEN